MNEKKNTGNHYIDKEEFSNEMNIHAADCRDAKGKGLQMPRCPESIGLKFLLIATNVANKGNFYNYPFKDEMICDALENMVRYRYNYRIEKGAAFSYFTQYAMYAFISRIKLEKKELTKKARWVQKIAIHDIIPHILNDTDLGSDFKNDYVEWLISYYDEKLDTVDKAKLVEDAPEAVKDLEPEYSALIGMDDD